MSSLQYNTRIYAEWGDPDPREMSVRLAHLSNYLMTTEAPMEGAKLIAISDIAEHFEREEDPDGTPWKEWSERYAPTAEGENVGILRKSEDLYYDAIDPSNYDVLPNSLYFDPSGLPEYWAVQNEGGGRNVPARPFIGLSGSAEGQIEDLFFKWMQFGGEVFIRGGKPVMSHVFQAPTGHFISAGTAR